MLKIISALSLSILILISFVGVAFADTSQEIKTYLFGDIDRDNDISSSDARLALRFAVSLEKYTKGQLVLGDTDGDGSMSSADARSILRYSVNLEEPTVKEVQVLLSDFEVFSDSENNDELFTWNTPAAPEINALPGTFTFTVYGYGHGVGLSQYGALTLSEAGYTYDKILAHYYTETELLYIDEFPAVTLYPVGRYTEESPDTLIYTKEEVPTQELLTRIVYQEIYGITEKNIHFEALKAQTVAVFTNLAYHGFDVDSRWDVGIASPIAYEDVPEELRQAVNEVMGLYISEKGEAKPIQAVYSGLAAGMTASAESIWGGSYSYLTSVESPFDMNRDGFISTLTYTVDEMRQLITAYSSDITLSEDPSEWIEILEHTASMDEDRGYVTKIRVGDKVLKGYNQFLMKLMNNKLRSPCFTVTYTPEA